MAEVFRAESQPIAGVVRPVAIKKILGGGSSQDLTAFRDALIHEARIWVRLQHPNIVSVVDFGEQDGDWFLALELVDGLDASELVKRTGPFSPEEAYCIVERVARALDHAHTLEGNG